MSRTKRRSKRRQEEKSNSKMSIMFIIVLIIAVAGIGWYFFDEFNYRSNYNSLVTELGSAFKSDESKEVESCTEKLEKVYQNHKSNPERAEPLKEHLIKCYRFFASNPKSPLKVQLKNLEKIHELDPKSLSSVDIKLLETLKK